MAFGGGGSGRVRSEINVTPLVDVVLVLLIIFLVALPVVLKNIVIDVPNKIDETPDVVVPDQITIEVTKAGALLLNGIEINRTDLAVKLRDRLEHKREKAVFVDFDDNTRYGDAVSVVDTAKGAGATTIAIKMKDSATASPAAGGTGGAPAPGGGGAPPTVTPINP
jgi:biopolymer transport protein ExbD